MGICVGTGDLFAIPLDAATFAVGLVAGRWHSELYLVVFGEVFTGQGNVNAAQLAALTPVLAASSLDAKLWHGPWPLIQRGVTMPSLLQPVYRSSSGPCWPSRLTAQCSSGSTTIKPRA